MDHINFRDFKLTEETIRAIRVEHNDEEEDPSTFSLLEEQGITITKTGFSKEEKAEWRQALREIRKQIYAYDMPNKDRIYEYMQRYHPENWEYSESAWKVIEGMFGDAALVHAVYEKIQSERKGGPEEAPADFELSNKDTDAWTPTQFLEKDPFNTESIAQIVLCVNWEDKTATVETRPDNGSYPMREHNGLDSSYTIPNTTDFSQFPSYFLENIRPFLEAMGRAFETHWNGSDWIGRFDFKEAPEDLGTEEQICNNDLDDLLRDAPQTETLAYFDVGDSFQAYHDIIGILENEGIDFMTADLDDPETVQKIREALEDGVVYIMDNEELAKDLLRMRESIDEEEEEA